MVFTEEPEVLDRYNELKDNAVVDTITNIWTTAAGWFDAHMWGATLALLLLLIGGIYLLSARRRTRA